MKKNRKEKDFLHLPHYPGGKDAFREFLRQNLKYPPEALRNKIQGKVYVSYEVNDNGEVFNPVVVKPLGYGCDEEALRLVGMMRYEKVKNRGVRLKSRVKTHIEFRLAEVKQGISYSYVTVKQEDPQKLKEPGKPAPGASYTITIRRQQGPAD